MSAAHCVPTGTVQERSLDAGCILGEGPVWNEAERCLMWTYIYGSRLCRWRPEPASYDAIPVGEPVTAFAPRAKGGFIAATMNRTVLLDARLAIAAVLRVDLPTDGSRFNDGKCDRLGQFWVGSISPNSPGDLYCLDLAGVARIADSGFQLCNGLDWSPDGRWMYVADSGKRLLYRYEVGANGHSLENRCVFADFSREQGVPDGLTVDAEGCVWCALWDGGAVIRLDPSGEPVARLRTPVPRPTSCAFGDVDLETLYVTSARHGLSQDRLGQAPLSGGVFDFRVGVRGRPPHSCRI